MRLKLNLLWTPRNLASVCALRGQIPTRLPREAPSDAVNQFRNVCTTEEDTTVQGLLANKNTHRHMLLGIPTVGP